jgi:hypothetical protein
MIRRPGDNRIEIAAACAGRFKVGEVDCTNLWMLDRVLISDLGTYSQSAYTKTNSVRMTVVLWK